MCGIAVVNGSGSVVTAGSVGSLGSVPAQQGISIEFETEIRFLSLAPFYPIVCFLAAFSPSADIRCIFIIIIIIIIIIIFTFILIFCTSYS